jgi:hypothetical protein
MKRLALLAGRFTAIYLVMIGASLFIGEAVFGTKVYGKADPPPPPACANCTQGWAYIPKDLPGAAGSSECQHGTQYDAKNKANCKEPAKFDNPAEFVKWNKEHCYELNGGMGDCYCFKCGDADAKGCESETLIWLAWCGAEDKDHKGACDLTTKAQAVIRFDRKARTKEREACAFGKNGFENVKKCGQKDQGMSYSCATNSCVGDGAWTGNFGQFQYCTALGDTYSFKTIPIIMNREKGVAIYIIRPDGKIIEVP